MAFISAWIDYTARVHFLKYLFRIGDSTLDSGNLVLLAH